MTDTTSQPSPTTAAEEFVSGIDVQLASIDGVGEGDTERRRYKFRTVIERCGWDRRSNQRMQLLQSLLVAHGVHSDRTVTDPYLDLDDFIHFTRQPAPIPTQSLKRESELVEYVIQNFRFISPLNEYGTALRKEETLKSGKRVDLIIEDPKRKRWLIVEFKNAAKTAGTAGAQLITYMQEVKGTILPRGFTIEGMVISPPVDPVQVRMLINSQREAPGPISWLTFNLRLELVPAPGSVTLSATGGTEDPQG